MGHVVSSIVGGIGTLFGGGGDKPKVSSAATDETEAAARTAKTARSALYETQGGVEGAELAPDDVQNRRTLLGN